jgi:hypothetical protein
MAEIKIEKKNPVWPWILLVLLILAGILYFVLIDNDDVDINDDFNIEKVIINDENALEDDTNSPAMMQYDTAIKQYSNFIGKSAEMGIDHEYSHRAITLIINTIEAKADVLDVNIDADLQNARENADRIMKEPYDVNHSDLIKESGIIIVRSLTTLKESNYPNLSSGLENIEENLESISKEQLTLDQKSDVNSFFKAVEGLLIKMN